MVVASNPVANPLAAVELPLRAVVWQDDQSE
jgi:hypothetical protein